MKVDPAHLTSLFENATEGIVLTDRSGKIVLVNPAAQRMFDYKEEELIQHPIEVLIPQRYQSYHKELRHDFYQHPQNREMGHGRDLYAKKKDGSDMPVEVSLSHYKKDNELYVIAFIIDITQRKRIEHNIKMQQQELEQLAGAMRKLNAQLEAKVEERTLILKEALKKLEESQEELSEALSKEKQLNEIKSRFVSMASHEFRTPLSTILSSATLVSKYTGPEENEKRERHVKKIKDSVGHLNNLLEDFLSLGKLEEGKVSVSISSFAVKEFIDDIIEEMKVIQKKGQQIICKYEGGENFTTDKRLLKNILINLFSNSFKFSGEDSNVWIDVLNKGNGLSVVMKDEGVGIPEEDQHHLFTTFFRGKNVTNIEGTGLGLPIVKRYVDLLNGTVSLKSKLGEGTTIDFTLPKLSGATDADNP
ncbi:MAG TPA: PAS domain-containing sensor histidine kinase [Chitinophagaceae bacterium]|nr:PAS domain-containing sensor histidine kinase [Chitinophagaceae bacterium]